MASPRSHQAQDSHSQTTRQRRQSRFKKASYQSCMFPMLVFYSRLQIHFYCIKTVASEEATENLKCKDETIKDRNKMIHDRNGTVKDLPNLQGGNRMWITNMKCNRWVQYTSEATRSNVVAANKGIVCRNRQHLV
ncbi:hypothetical protein PR048_014934 [Dryococelus australis]|uniref:Uncharacterized protein n=1 Tax=Dryococelus australis TaxID=614101 RepID=A0ABQ9HFJ0_9NEOP|nr:hypothetical protein PR048_014934 [Dryococelus australis]